MERDERESRGAAEALAALLPRLLAAKGARNCLTEERHAALSGNLSLADRIAAAGGTR